MRECVYYIARTMRKDVLFKYGVKCANCKVCEQHRKSDGIRPLLQNGNVIDVERPCRTYSQAAILPFSDQSKSRKVPAFNAIAKEEILGNRKEGKEGNR